MNEAYLTAIKHEENITHWGDYRAAKLHLPVNRQVRPLKKQIINR